MKRGFRSGVSLFSKPVLIHSAKTGSKHRSENAGRSLRRYKWGVALLFWQQGQHYHRIHRLLHGKGGERLYARAPKDFADIERFLREMPYITAKFHGEKYRFMYRCTPAHNIVRHGKKFFRGVNVRYHQYAVLLSDKLGMPVDFIQGMIYIFVRACVHYALFEDEEYLKLQLDAIRTSLRLFVKESKQRSINNETKITQSGVGGSVVFGGNNRTDAGNRFRGRNAERNFNSDGQSEQSCLCRP